MADKRKPVAKRKPKSESKELDPVRSAGDTRKDVVEGGIEDIDLASLHSPNSKYTANQKVAAAMAYVLTGNSKHASKLCDVPATTIRDWKSMAQWWDETLDACRKEKQEDLDGIITGVIHLAMDQVQDLVANGEVVRDRDGLPMPDPQNPEYELRRKLSVKELTVTLGILYDKRNLLRGDPTQIAHKTEGNADMKSLAEEFAQLSKEIRAKNEAKIIEGEVVE